MSEGRSQKTEDRRYLDKTAHLSLNPFSSVFCLLTSVLCFKETIKPIPACLQFPAVF